MTTKKTILVVDDDTAILDALTIVLTDSGFKVKTMASGHELLELTSPLPDLIVLDIWLADMDGREVCKKLKSDPKTAHIPVIVFSANKNIEQLSLEAGADGYLAKPFSIADLLSKVTAVISPV